MDYYPFGMPMAHSYKNDPRSQNRYWYNAGSRYNDSTGHYQMHYRHYDATLGRFNLVDPYANEFANLSPYNYGGNNPIMFNDPSGGRMYPNPDHLRSWRELASGGGGLGGGPMHSIGPGSGNHWADAYSSQMRDYAFSSSRSFENKWDMSTFDYQVKNALEKYGREAWLALMSSKFFSSGNRYKWYELIEGGTVQADRIKVKESFNMFDYFPGGKYFWSTHMGQDLKSMIPCDCQPYGETIMTSGKGGNGSSTTAERSGIIVDPITRALPDKWSLNGLVSWYNRARDHFTYTGESWPIDEISGDTIFYNQNGNRSYNIGDTLFLVHPNIKTGVNDTSKQHRTGQYEYWFPN
ncbi:RHS repeat-associated core domain-containing protein [Marivirga lumbricoides]